MSRHTHATGKNLLFMESIDYFCYAPRTRSLIARELANSGADLAELFDVQQTRV